LSELKTDYIALSEVADVRFSSVDKHTVAIEKPVRLCNYTDVFKNRFISNSMDFMTASATDSEIERFGLRHGDIAITKDSETPDEIGIPALIEQPASDLVLGYHLALIRAKAERCDPYFLSAALQTRHVARHYLRTAVGLTRFGLSIKAVADTPVPNLPLVSQRRIGRWYREAARMESHIDALIAAKREQKRGLMQQLLTGKVRFPGFTEPWKPVRLGDVAHEVSERNKGQLAEQDVCGVIKGAGLMPMRERVMGDDLTRYLVVSPNSFAYNPMRLNIGSIAFNSSHRRVLVSPDYVVFSTRPTALRPNYLNHVRSSWIWEKFVQRAGSGSVRTRIYFDDLATLKLPLPGAAEQDRIDSALRGMDSEINLLVQQREALATQRRGLMERLLTGEIDIPSSDTYAA
jgi:type I restriction enzyme S subunit